MPWNVLDEGIFVVSGEIDWLSRTMMPVQEWEERLAALGRQALILFSLHVSWLL
jgi:hypothetical protein